MAELLWKPEADDASRGAAFVALDVGSARVPTVTVTTPDGQRKTVSIHTSSPGHGQGQNIYYLGDMRQYPKGTTVQYGDKTFTLREDGNRRQKAPLSDPSSVYIDAGGPGDSPRSSLTTQQPLSQSYLQENYGDLVPGQTVVADDGIEYLRTPGGFEYVGPRSVDFSSLQFSPVSYEDNLRRAREQGEINQAEYNRLLSEGQSTALDLIGTDVEGIRQGAEELVPFVREQTDIDQQSQLRRAEQVSSFRLDENARINERLRNEAVRANELDQQFFDEANAATGIAYKDTINEAMDRILGGETTQRLLREQRSSGAEIAAAAGIGGTSGATRNLLDIRSADALANTGAQAAQVATQAQSLLRRDPRRVDILTPAPTETRVLEDRIGERLPVTSPLSAGQTAIQLANTGSELSSLSPGAVLSTGLQTDQFNTSNLFNRDQYVLDQQQNVLSAEDTAAQDALNAEAQIRQNDLDRQAYYDGLKARQDSEQLSFYGQLLQTGLQAAPAIAGLISGGTTLGSLSTGSLGTSATVGAGGAVTTTASTGGATAASQTLASSGAAGAGTAAAILAVAATTGLGISKVIQGISDGDITESDINNAVNATGGNLNNAALQGFNELVGRPIDDGAMREVSRGLMLANPLTAPFAGLQIAGVDFGFDSGKSIEQQRRDAVRDRLNETSGIKENDWVYTFEDGTSFDFGKDGNATIGTGDSRRAYHEIDSSNKSTQALVEASQPLALLYAMGVGGTDANSEEQKEINRHTLGMFVNSAQEGGGGVEEQLLRIGELYNNMGYTQQSMAQAMDVLVANDAISLDQANQYLANSAIVFELYAQKRGVSTGQTISNGTNDPFGL